MIRINFAAAAAKLCEAFSTDCKLRAAWRGALYFDDFLDGRKKRFVQAHEILKLKNYAIEIRSLRCYHSVNTSERMTHDDDSQLRSEYERIRAVCLCAVCLR